MGTRAIDANPDLWEKSCEHLSNVFWWTAQRFTRLADYQQRLSAGLGMMEPELRAQQESVWKNPPLRFLKGNTEAEQRESLQAIHDLVGRPSNVVDITVSHRLAQDRGILDASVLALAHSSLDTALLFLCELTGLMDPDWWLDRLGGRKVSLADVRSIPPERLCRQALRSSFDQLERDGVLKMFDRLTELTKPNNVRLESGERLDRTRLVSLDSRRHSLVHGTGLPTDTEDVLSDVQFFQQQVILLIVAVAEEFEIYIHGGKISDFLKNGGELYRLIPDDDD